LLLLLLLLLLLVWYAGGNGRCAQRQLGTTKRITNPRVHLLEP
jgi:hypothetical protein